MTAREIESGGDADAGPQRRDPRQVKVAVVIGRRAGSIVQRHRFAPLGLPSG